MKPSANPVHAIWPESGTRLRLVIVILTAIGLAGCQASASNDFKSKYKKIQLDMSEEEVDQIMAGYPGSRRELLPYEQEEPGDGAAPLKRKASFMKVYDCKLGANEGDFFIHVYFDDNYQVVGTVMSEYIS